MFSNTRAATIPVSRSGSGCTAWRAMFISIRFAANTLRPQVPKEPKSGAPNPCPKNFLLASRMQCSCRIALEKLPEDKREVLVLSRFHDLRYQEIALILKCEVGTVKVRVYRALKELREKFCELRGERLYDV